VDERARLERHRSPGAGTSFICALPTRWGYDGSDDLLDPKPASACRACLSPEASFQGQAPVVYVRSPDRRFGLFALARRQDRHRQPRPYRSIAGAGRDRIAPSRRFYAGGGGSVRGYGFQRIGPLDANNDPIGGRSLAEFSLEGRIRLPYFGGNFGVVPFIDAGTISTSLYPRIGDLRVGAGVGLRYYSNFGPIRIDVGAPLNPRKGDSPGGGLRLTWPGLLGERADPHRRRRPLGGTRARAGVRGCSNGSWAFSWPCCCSSPAQ
jgi:translocation and assembly module TamA